MQKCLLHPRSDPTILMPSTELCILTSEHSTGSFKTACLVGGVENDVSDGRQRELCQTVESFNGLCVAVTRFVWQTKSACVG